MPRISKAAKLAKAKSLMGGVSKHLLKHSTYRMGGDLYSPKELVDLFRSHMDALDEVDAARNRFAVAVAAERALAKRVVRIDQLLKGRIQSDVGFRADVWADFGWRLPKPPGPKTAAAKAAGVRKRQAARGARKRGERKG